MHGNASLVVAVATERGLGQGSLITLSRRHRHERIFVARQAGQHLGILHRDMLLSKVSSTQVGLFV